MLLYLSSKHSNVILNVSIKKYIYYNEIYSIPAKSLGIMIIPAEPGTGQNRLILAGTGILPGIPVDPYLSQFSVCSSCDFLTGPFGNFFWTSQTAQWRKLYIDIVDVFSSAKAQRLHQLLKYNIIPQGVPEFTYPECTTPVSLGDIELMQEISIEDTQLLLDSCDTLKRKVVFIAGYITFKHGEMEGDPVSTEFLRELD